MNKRHFTVKLHNVEEVRCAIMTSHPELARELMQATTRVLNVLDRLEE
jgi:hypothetical protein